MKAHYEDNQGVTLYHGDCIEVMRSLPSNSVHSVVTDPPYGLEFMGRDWDGSDGFRRSLNAADAGRENVFGRASRTSPEYKAGELFGEWCAEWAREAYRVLKPGGHMLAFGGSRTWHRLAVGIEEAGFELRDSIAWLYGSGFPKSLDVAKAIDKIDATDERLRRNRSFTEWLRGTALTAKQLDAATSSFMGNHYLTDQKQAAVPTRAMFERIRPLIGETEVPDWVNVLIDERDVESINFARRPEASHASRPGMAESWTEGSGWNGKDARGGTAVTAEAMAWEGWGTALKPAFEPIVVARKPLTGTVATNVLAHGTGALNIAATRKEATDTQLAAKYASVQNAGSRKNSVYGADTRSREGSEPHPQGRWPMNVVLDEDQAQLLGAEAVYFPTFHYEAKAPGTERPDVDGVQHPTVKPLELMRWLVRLVTSPGGTVLEPFAGSGTTLEACLIEGFNVIGIEREETYLPLIMQRISKPLQQSLFGDFE